jgi:hypothetical protein
MRALRAQTMRSMNARRGTWPACARTAYLVWPGSQTHHPRGIGPLGALTSYAPGRIEKTTGDDMAVGRSRLLAVGLRGGADSGIEDAPFQVFANRAWKSTTAMQGCSVCQWISCA